MINQRRIDDIDLRILSILQEKARVPNAEIARQIAMAPSAVLERIRKLEERGIIDGYEVRLNPDVFQQGLLAFIHVSIQPACSSFMTDALAAVTGVQDVHQIAGDDGYLLKVRAADNAELGRILATEIGRIEGVHHTRTHIVLETIKETRKITLTPID
ncbi:MAG: Lrp/AsnC family transcriptional regulator [Pelovirga sp.]